jgi:hypothetical protein
MSHSAMSMPLIAFTDDSRGGRTGGCAQNIFCQSPSISSVLADQHRC